MRSRRQRPKFRGHADRTSLRRTLVPGRRLTPENLAEAVAATGPPWLTYLPAWRAGSEGYRKIRAFLDAARAL